MISRRKFGHQTPFEETFIEDEERGDVMEVAIGSGPFFFVGALAIILVSIVAGRIIYLNAALHDFYQARASVNLSSIDRTEAPRGLIVDRSGVVVADNRVSFSLVLDVASYIKNPQQQESAEAAIFRLANITPDAVRQMIREREQDQNIAPIVILEDIPDADIISIQTLQIPCLVLTKTYRRSYPEPEIFSSVLGYTSLATVDDLKKNPTLSIEDQVGRAGVESFYDSILQGVPGVSTKIRNARGEFLENKKESDPHIGATLRLTIDADLQRYLYTALKNRLADIGRIAGAGIAIDPANGEILALVSFPTFDSNVFAQRSGGSERQRLLSSPGRPLFNRVVSGLYNPGSTIKPLVGVAALSEKVTTPDFEVFSPGYLDIPNPYHPENPSRFLDWRYQGTINLASALAQSSNVYFYVVGGGARGVRGLGIARLRTWWQKFQLDQLTGIDLPGEQVGFLPDPDWKERSSGRAWLLGDTYHVAIGQGDLLVTPIRLITYIVGIASGGILPRPHLAYSPSDQSPLGDLTQYAHAISEVQKGMRLTVTSPKGTAYLLNGLPMPVAAKTGSAQIQNNTQENAFFVGYAPYENPKIALFVLIENSKEGSLNALPVARDVLQWYWKHRIKK